MSAYHDQHYTRLSFVFLVVLFLFCDLRDIVLLWPLYFASSLADILILSRHPLPPSQWAVDCLVRELWHALQGLSAEKGWKKNKNYDRIRIQFWIKKKCFMMFHILKPELQFA